MLTDAKKNGWLIFACLAILVLPFSASVAKQTTTNLDFRGLEVGMTIEEINQLESVKLGYLPRLTQDEANGSKNAVICRPAFIGVFIHLLETRDFEFDVRPKAFDAEHYKYFPDSRDKAGPPGTLICSANDSEEFLASRGSIGFTEAQLTFWNGRLISFWLRYEGAAEKLHKSLVDKYTSLPTFELIDEREIDGGGEYEISTVIASSNPTNGLVASLQKKGYLDFGTKGLDKIEAFKGSILIADVEAQNEIERIIANTFKQHTDQVVEKRGFEREKQEQEEELNKKFFN